MALVALVAIVAKYTAAAQLGGLGAARPSLLEALRVTEAGQAKQRDGEVPPAPRCESPPPHVLPGPFKIRLLLGCFSFFFQWLELNYRAAFRLGTRYTFTVGSEFGSPSNSLCETSAATPRPIKPRAALMLAAPRGHQPPPPTLRRAGVEQ